MDNLWKQKQARTGKLISSILLLTILLASFSLSVAPTISFVSPTPANGATTTDTTINIEADLTESSLKELIYTWDGNPFTIYDDSLIAMYNFDEFSSGVTPDSSIQGIDANVFEATYHFFIAKFGTSFTFDGVNDYIEAPTFPNMGGYDQFTFTSWIYPLDLSEEGTILSNYNGATMFGNTLQTRKDPPLPSTPSANGILCSTAATQFAETNSLNLQENQWYQIVCVYDGTQSSNSDKIKIYVNGQEQSKTVTGTIPSSIGGDTDLLRIGGDNDTLRYFDGALDEVRIWDRALSEEEINQLYFTNLRKLPSSDNWKLEISQSETPTTPLPEDTYLYQIEATNSENETSQTEERSITISSSNPNPDPVCGDNTIEGNEVCDNNSQACTTLEGYSGSQDCNSQCSAFDSCVTAEFCGDSQLNGNEVCELSDSQSCTTLDGYSGTQNCALDCSQYNSCVTSEFCGDNIINGNEQCDEGVQNGQEGSCDLQCSGFVPISTSSTPLEKQNLNTCQGEGELFLYKDTPFQNLDTSFTTDYDELYIFTRSDFISNVDVKLNGILTPKTTVIDVTTPFHVRIYKITTTPGDLVEISDGAALFDSRSIQGYLTQNSANRAYDISNFEIIFDDENTDTVYLEPGIYNYLFLDKYSLLTPPAVPDNRNLNVQITTPSNAVVHDQTYTLPHPAPVEGMVKGTYSIAVSGFYTIHLDTEDSVYWFDLECSTPDPICGDGNLDAGEQCDDGNSIDDDACSNSCTPNNNPFCGDGHVDPGEECDDGNNNDNDSCSNSCDFNEGECEDKDNDDVCDEEDMCPNSKLNAQVDSMGCDQSQFCKKEAFCGYSCDYADFMGDEPGQNPYDCKTIIIDVEGVPQPTCAAIVLECQDTA